MELSFVDKNNQILQQTAVINRYRKMIDDLNTKLKDCEGTRLTRRPSICEKYSNDDFFSSTPEKLVRQSSMWSNSSACEEWNTISKKNISFAINLSEARSSPKQLNTKKYIEIRRVSSIEPVFLKKS